MIIVLSTSGMLPLVKKYITNTITSTTNIRIMSFEIPSSFAAFLFEFNSMANIINNGVPAAGEDCNPDHEQDKYKCCNQKPT